MNKQTIRLLDTLKSEFIDKLSQHCAAYISAEDSNPNESPRWIQYRGDLNIKDGGGLVKSLYFQSSQDKDISFYLPLDDLLTPQERSRIEVEEYQKLYDYFRDVKYKYLADKWPTITIPSEYKKKVKEKITEIKQPEQFIPIKKDDGDSEYDIQAKTFLNNAGVSISWKFDKFGKYFDDDKQNRNIFIWELRRDDIAISGKFGDSIVNSCKPTPIINSNEDCEIYWGVKIGGGEHTYNVDKGYGIKQIVKEISEPLFLSHIIKTNYATLRKIKAGELEPIQLINDTKLFEDWTRLTEKAAKQKRKITPFDSLEFVSNKIVTRILAFIKDAETKTTLLDQDDEIIQPSEYDLLSCITKYDPGTFENFCSDFGYDTDSRRAEKTYHAVVEEWNKVKSLFTEEELQQLSEIN